MYYPGRRGHHIMVTQGVLKPRRIVYMISTDDQFQQETKTDTYQVRMIKFEMRNGSGEKNYFVKLVQCHESQNLRTEQLFHFKEL
jgi:hypothetical protein